jgi:hypothetical protein
MTNRKSCWFFPTQSKSNLNKLTQKRLNEMTRVSFSFNKGHVFESSFGRAAALEFLWRVCRPFKSCKARGIRLYSCTNGK